MPLVKILVGEKNAFYVVHSRLIGYGKEVYKWKDRVYHLDWDNPTYRTGFFRKPVFVYLLNCSKPLSISNPKIQPALNSSKLNLILGKNIIEQLAKAGSVEFTRLVVLVMIILALLGGLGMGFMLYPYLTPSGVA